jgi:hypothetical protein
MSVAVCYIGSLLIYDEGGSAFDSAVDNLNMSPSSVAFHRDRSLGRSCSSPTLPILALWPRTARRLQLHQYADDIQV